MFTINVPSSSLNEATIGLFDGTYLTVQVVALIYVVPPRISYP